MSGPSTGAVRDHPNPTPPAKKPEKPQEELRPSKEFTAVAIPYMNAIGTEMVDIYVGPSKTLFRLYKSKLCTRIPYFSKMFNGSFKEATSNTAYLPEDSPSCFDLLADWANHPTPSVCPRKIRDLETVTDGNGNDVASWDAVGFYSLAEKYGLGELQDIIIDTLIKYQKKRNELPSVEFTVRAYEQTSAGSPLAQYCTRAIIHITRGGNEEGWSSADVARLYKVLPNFAEDCVAMQREMPDGPDPRVFPMCAFHVHGKGEHCPAVPSRKRKAEASRKPVLAPAMRRTATVEDDDEEK